LENAAREAGVTHARQKSPTPIKPEIDQADRFERHEIIKGLDFGHSIVTLDLDQLSSNIRAAALVTDDVVFHAVMDCISGAVREAWRCKRRCQTLIGLYLEDVFILDQPQVPIDRMCPLP